MNKELWVIFNGKKKHCMLKLSQGLRWTGNNSRNPPHFNPSIKMIGWTII